MLKRNLLPLIALLAAAPAAYAVKDDGGGYRAGPTAPPRVADPSQARKTFNLGFEEYQMAEGLEGASADLTGEQAATTREAVTAGFTRARDKFRAATVDDPKMKEAWNMLGFTSRKLGNFEDSLQAYEAALTLDPNYPEAIEYRAELFLLMGRLGDAKEAYATLLKSAPPIAQVLKTSMQDWVKTRQATPGVSDADREEFAAWVKKL